MCLHPPDCSLNYTSWDPTLLDEIYADFAAAVGPNHTVAMQLSTLPSWMFTDGLNVSACPASPWEPCMDYGRKGGRLRDATCGEVARYIARLVGWFTQGGARDECGAWHPSGHHHEWAVLSVREHEQSGNSVIRWVGVFRDFVRRSGTTRAVAVGSTWGCNAPHVRRAKRHRIERAEGHTMSN